MSVPQHIVKMEVPASTKWTPSGVTVRVAMEGRAVK